MEVAQSACDWSFFEKCNATSEDRFVLKSKAVFRQPTDFESWATFAGPNEWNCLHWHRIP